MQAKQVISCDQCGDEFTGDSAEEEFKSHALQFHSESGYKCSNCDNVYDSENAADECCIDELEEEEEEEDDS